MSEPKYKKYDVSYKGKHRETVSAVRKQDVIDSVNRERKSYEMMKDFTVTPLEK